MKNLNFKNLLVAVSMLFASHAFAFDFDDLVDLIDHGNGQSDRWRPEDPRDRPGRPGRPGRGDLYCEARDNGWEEHRNGHRNCQECVAAHGNCTETCQETFQEWACTVEGVRPDGRTIPFTGRSQDRRAAADDAEDQCYGARFRQCRYVGCDREVSHGPEIRRDCRRGGRR